MAIVAATSVIDGITYDYVWDGNPFAYNPQGFAKGIDRDNGPWIDVQYDVPWGYSDAFANNLMGIGTYAAGLVGWPVPRTYPDNPFLSCMDIRMVAAIGAARATLSGGFAATQCRYAASFRRPRFDVSGTEMGQYVDFSAGSQPFLEVTKHVGVRDVVIPAESLQIAGAAAGEVPSRDEHIEEAVIELEMTRWWLPYFPDRSLDALINKLNDAVFLGYPRGYVKFQDFQVQRSTDVGGSTIQQVRLLLQILERDWNSTWSPKPGEGFKLLATTTPLYGYRDLSQILELTS